MSEFNHQQWQLVDGDWEIDSERLLQRRNTEATRCWQQVEHSDYRVGFTMRLVETGPGVQSEAKLIFSDADASEFDRVDFISSAVFGACRVSVSNVPFPAQILTIVPGRSYDVEIMVKGNFLSVKFDGLEIYRHFQIGKRSDGRIGFGTYNAQVEFLSAWLRKYDRKKCFVVMPFDQHRNFLYEDVVNPQLQSHPDILFDFIRADESLRAGRVSQEICEKIAEAEIVIADVSGRNPNVYYELGYAHALSKPVVLLIERGPTGEIDLPFDIQDFRCHGYEFSRQGFADLAQKLPAILAASLR